MLNVLIVIGNDDRCSCSSFAMCRLEKKVGILAKVCLARDYSWVSAPPQLKSTPRSQAVSFCMALKSADARWNDTPHTGLQCTKSPPLLSVACILLTQFAEWRRSPAVYGKPSDLTRM